MRSFRETMTGSHADRLQLKTVVGKLTADDVVIIPGLVRLSRDETDLLASDRDINAPARNCGNWPSRW